MKYELWANMDEAGLCFFCIDSLAYEHNLEIFKAVEGEIKLIWSVETETHNEAMQKYYDFMSWGKYHPIDE